MRNCPKAPMNIIRTAWNAYFSTRSVVMTNPERPENATRDDLGEAVTTLEETERTARRVLGGANPATGLIKGSLHSARAALAARETAPTSNNA